MSTPSNHVPQPDDFQDIPELLKTLATIQPEKAATLAKLIRVVTAEALPILIMLLEHW
jgi:hypothetical protein